ncbi:MAG TPA: zf-HC2 domain-containing protein [Solirubrobacterales bacterium]
MTAESCREWRGLLGVYALDQLPVDERAGIEAHLEGCPECRAELDSLAGVTRLMPLADPERFGSAPRPPAALGDRVLAAVESERRTGERRVRGRRRWRFGLALGGVATAAAALAIFVLGGGGGEGPPEREVAFHSLPSRMEIDTTLIPHSFGTEIHVYVSGVRSGTLCRVFLRDEAGQRSSAGSFRYRWGEDSEAVLTSALDLSNAATVGIRVGGRTFEAGV